ncbi:MAG: PEP-utilizing enzyme [Bacteroidetes bacterium]|nr:PEP-utilizing enzyme [Bacteroidota bacterium]
MLEKLKNIFKFRPKEVTSFQEKFEHFQAFLKANDESHKIMSDLSELINSGKPFSRGYATRSFDNMIDALDRLIFHFIELVSGRYWKIKDKFTELRDTCYKILLPRVLCPEGFDCPSFECNTCTKYKKIIDDIPYYYNLDEIDESLYLVVGSKMSRLGEIKNQLGIPVPDGFSLSVRFFENVMLNSDLRGRKNKIFYNVDFDEFNQIEKASRETQEMIVNADLPDELDKIVNEAYQKAFPNKNGLRLAVRSSAIGEDSANFSFAGLHKSLLNVKKENLLDSCIEVLVSKYSPESLVYRYLSGLRDEDMPMSVGIIEMIDAHSAGVLYTADPLHINEGIIIQGVWGLGDLVVQGKVVPQQFVVSHDKVADLLRFSPGKQDILNISELNGSIHKSKLTDDMLNTPCLNSYQIKELVGYALRIEEHFQTPQDIEWAVDKNGKVFILQARPLQIKSLGREKRQSISLDEIDKKYKLLIDSGECASHGVKFGTVFIVEHLKDLKNFPKEGILVAKKNLPEFAGLIHKASAVITDVGSTTGHLSIIAREQGVPMLTNTNNASELLQNGMEVTIYADEGRVYLSRVSELIDSYKASIIENNAFINSPMSKIWHSVGKYIFKLNLTDPNEPNFNPLQCQTLHDIIRYTHEKALTHMFSLYSRDNYDTGTIYKLEFDVPLDFYVIDLGNGLKVEGETEVITPQNIVSQPLLALIKGMTTPGIRWSGHLSLDTKGFASLVFGNVVDVYRSESVMGARTYALVSENYLNFFSRLGYHFSRLDTFVSEEINTNYINFNFRGGAADNIRRTRRGIVIEKILDSYGFITNRYDDNIIASVTKIPMDRILFLLSELGRMMGAVRNADVIFTSEEVMNRFIELFLEGDPSPGTTIHC